jgi:cell division protein YceG involved in septum cleavage
MNSKDFLEKLKSIAQKLNLLGEYCYKHTFLVFVALTVVIFAVAGIIFYHYAISEGLSNQNLKNDEVKIDQDLYQKIISRASEKKEIFNKEVRIDQSLPDPFK